uniref:AlNc14C19G1947 protein n=1 Tax=Albugo laibachii Nc14 TaxID=890382 RepID=F0W4X6_9STRA|nr:AlNc14C19G1947 [Albugo laibachii Nc14]|eukprot:CCA16166.1 AlNc14C19G1947 [Albugo laibachii Nc14]
MTIDYREVNKRIRPKSDLMPYLDSRSVVLGVRCEQDNFYCVDDIVFEETLDPGKLIIRVDICMLIVLVQYGDEQYHPTKHACFCRLCAICLIAPQMSVSKPDLFNAYQLARSQRKERGLFGFSAVEKRRIELRSCCSLNQTVSSTHPQLSTNPSRTRFPQLLRKIYATKRLWRVAVEANAKDPGA